MFRQNKNYTLKTNESGNSSHSSRSKDNFPVVTAKHTIASPARGQTDVTTSNARLKQNFQFLKQTRNFDLVLGENRGPDVVQKTPAEDKSGRYGNVLHAKMPVPVPQVKKSTVKEDIPVSIASSSKDTFARQLSSEDAECYDINADYVNVSSIIKATDDIPKISLELISSTSNKHQDDIFTEPELPSYSSINEYDPSEPVHIGSRKLDSDCNDTDQEKSLLDTVHESLQLAAKPVLRSEKRMLVTGGSVCTSIVEYQGQQNFETGRNTARSLVRETTSVQAHSFSSDENSFSEIIPTNWTKIQVSADDENDLGGSLNADWERKCNLHPIDDSKHRCKDIGYDREANHSSKIEVKCLPQLAKSFQADVSGSDEAINCRGELERGKEMNVLSDSGEIEGPGVMINAGHRLARLGSQLDEFRSRLEDCGLDTDDEDLNPCSEDLPEGVTQLSSQIDRGVHFNQKPTSKTGDSNYLTTTLSSETSTSADTTTIITSAQYGLTASDDSCLELPQTSSESQFTKRSSRARNYENWTINRVLTALTSDADSVYSGEGEADSPDEASASSARESPLAQGNKNSDLSEDSTLPAWAAHLERLQDSVFVDGQTDQSSAGLQESDTDEEDSASKSTTEDTDTGSEVADDIIFVPKFGLRRHKLLTNVVDWTSEDTQSLSGLSLEDSQSLTGLSLASDGDEESAGGLDSSFDETDSGRDGLLRMRQLLVKGVLDSEKAYLNILSTLIHYKRSLEASSMSSQPVISHEDIQAIFSNIETVNLIHAEFVQALESRVNNWTHKEEVGIIFINLISRLIEFRSYLNNYPLAVSTIHRCCQESDQFSEIVKKVTVGNVREAKEVTNLEDALFKPVQRVQRNTLVLHDLIKYTPEDHPDYLALLDALKLSQDIIEEFATSIPQIINPAEKRRLVKSSFLVELVGGVRKLRYVFLFNDVLVCTKTALNRTSKPNFTIKWFATLNQLNIDSKFKYKEEDTKSFKKDDIYNLRNKLNEQKKELRELIQTEDKEKHYPLVSLSGVGPRNVEKLKKKIYLTEAQLILAAPKLPLRLLIEGGKPSTLLMSTDYEREEWREVIINLSKKCAKSDYNSQSISSIIVQEAINNVKEMPQVNKIGDALLKHDEEFLMGTLHVTIHKASGLTQTCDTYCNIEMDSFGHFFNRAKTKVCEATRDPAWSEDFDLDLEGSQTLRILCFQKMSVNQGDILLGKVALELSKQWLRGSFQEKTISINEISLVISVRHTPASKSMQRLPSRTNTAVFGVSVFVCARREGKTVPTVVTACVQEVERRGLDEVGVYRVSGVSSELQNIKKIMDKNVAKGCAALQEADIHAVTGVLKLYLRELPEPLFTEASYHRFVDTLKLSDEEAKTQCMLALLHNLPDTNYYTAVSLLEHLTKVAQKVGANKMSIHNLSTVFGPTLLAPAAKFTSKNPLEMMSQGAEQVMYQSSVINFLLGLCVRGKSLRRSA